MKELETRMRIQSLTREVISGFMNANHVPPHMMVDALNSVLVELQTAAITQVLAERDTEEQQAREAQMVAQQQSQISQSQPTKSQNTPQEEKVSK